MIQAIASLGRGLGMATIAEGVETELQADLVRRAGVTEMQGYLISRPLPESALAALVLRLDTPTAANLPVAGLAVLSTTTAPD
jgi:EAL domain-containing protein (putative c-di-GMP-specific phosphodiesterase class I)